MREFDIGETIASRYVILDAPHMGGQAFVYQAYDSKEDRVVGIKCLQQADRAGMQRFRLEARTHAKLDHPHIVPMLGTELINVGKDQSILLIIIEWVDSGKTLQTLIDEQHPIPLPEVLRFMWQMADAVAYAHEKGIIHRDLKPSNGLLSLDGDGRWLVKIADFGTVKIMNTLEQMASASMIKLTQTNTTLGTPFYMSPEQGMGIFGPGCDIWSFWVTAYMLLTGDFPYSASTHEEWINHWIKIRRNELTYRPVKDLRPDVTPELEDMIRQGFDPDPEKRLSMRDTVPLLKQMWEEADMATSNTQFHIHISSRPPQHDPNASTQCLQALAEQRQAEYRQRTSGKLPVSPATPPKIVVPAKKATPKTGPVVLVKAAPPASPGMKPSVVKPTKVIAPKKKGVVRPTARSSPEVGRASSPSMPTTDPRLSTPQVSPLVPAVEPVIVYVPTPVTSGQRGMPVAPHRGNFGWLLFLILGFVLVAATSGHWLPYLRARWNATQSVPIQNTAQAVDTVQPIPVATQPAATSVAPGVPVAPPRANPVPSKAVPRVGGAKDGPWVIDGLPPNAPPPNQ